MSVIKQETLKNESPQEIQERLNEVESSVTERPYFTPLRLKYGKYKLGSTYIEDIPEIVNQWRKDILHAENKWNCGTETALRKLLELGIEQMYLDESKDRQKTMFDEIDEILHKKKKEREKWARLDQLYLNTDFDEFCEYCNRFDVDIEEFMSNSRYAYASTEVKNKATMMRDFLRQNLSKDEGMSTQEIRKLAESQEAVKSDADWSYLCKIAQREGVLTDVKGYWML